MAGPLEGIQVLDWTQWQMGPVATAMLADLGATVIHIEQRVHGDPGRGYKKSRGVSLELPHGRNAYFECMNRGKKSIAIDLGKGRGREVVYRLVKDSDVFVHNFRQDVPERLGLDYETLYQYNPRLVYVAASGYGPMGPDAMEPAFDFLGLARSGIMNIIGEPDMPPLAVAGAIADQMGAIMTGYGILAALVARERLGIGQKVDVSLLGSMIALQGFAVGLRLYLGRELPRESRGKVANPLWNYYKCKDSRWLMLGMLASDRYWPAVCRGLNIEYLEKDTRFENAQRREENREQLVSIMDEIFITRSSSEWVRILKQVGDVVCTPVQTISDLLNDPQVLANNYIIDCNHEVLGPVEVIGVPVQLSQTPGVVKCEAPEFGQHTEEILTEIGGYSWEEITEFRKAEVI